MTTATMERRREAAPPRSLSIEQWPSTRTLIPHVLAGLAFLVLFWQPMSTMARDWWNDPNAGHGLLLGPLALVLAYRSGLRADSEAQPRLGLALLFGAILLRYASGLAAELFTMRMSLLGGAAALVIYYRGWRQILHWWLPTLLLALSVPLPAVLTGTIALPLQFQASRLGAAMLEWRNVPVLLSGNVIHLPGQTLFVTEACSGLRSLTSLLALGVLIGGLWLRSPVNRVLLVAMAIPIAMLLNGLRVFLTGFLIFFVDPRLGEGVMHITEGWLIFVIAFLMLGAIAAGLVQVEHWWKRVQWQRS